MPPVEIRPETPADHPAIRAVNEQAFGKPNEANLVDALRASPSFVPDLSLVAEREGQVIGHVLFSRLTVAAVGEPVEVLALAPVAVRPEWQRRGIGGRLIRAGL